MSTSWVNPIDFNKSLNQGLAEGSYSGTAIPAAMGGTAQTTLTSAFVGLFETVATTTGDLVYGGASGTPTRLAAGATSGYVLTSNGSAAAPSWQVVTSGTGTATPTASTISEWDANVNMGANNFLPLSTTITAAGTTTTLTAASNQVQVVTGSANQTIQLPNNTTGTNVRAGFSFIIINGTTWPGSPFYVTVQTTTPNALALLGPQESALFTSISTSGTGNLAWIISSCSSASGVTTTATAAGTTTLTQACTPIQVFTGSTTQTLKLPPPMVILKFELLNQ